MIFIDLLIPFLQFVSTGDRLQTCEFVSRILVIVTFVNTYVGESRLCFSTY